jgi:signal transduction histidine kinase
VSNTFFLMTPISVPHRWLAMLLGGALLLDTFLVFGSTSTPMRALLALPGAASFALCAWLAVHRPATGAIVGAFALTATSLLLRSVSVQTPSVGLTNIMLTELISGTVLVVLVVWRCTPPVAAACTTALVVSCLAAITIRQQMCDYLCDYFYGGGGSLLSIVLPSDLTQSGLFGFFLLVGAVSTGVYLRRSTRQRIETEMSALVRKQWPLGAALAAVALVELSEGGRDSVITLIGSLGVAVCAFFGPKYPLRNTLLGAAALVFSGLMSVVYGGSRWGLSLTAIAASMALIAYAVRYLPKRDAVLATAVLVGANVAAMALRNGSLLNDANMMLLLLFLLLVSVVAGWYFRARDRERNQTVRAAVTSAQQGERMALARELHDVVAHHVTGIVVQAQAALMVAEKNPAVAVPALEKIERSGTEALTAMRTLVGSLRDGTAAWTAGDSDATDQATTDLAADITNLVEHFTGPPVEMELDLPDELPHEVGRSVLRLVQESLTNVGKHAPDASAARVRVVHNGEWLHIRVTDDGAKRPVSPAGGSGGYGLVGMRERVELLGGRFEAGPSGYVGWNVEAWLPMRKEGS